MGTQSLETSISSALISSKEGTMSTQVTPQVTPRDTLSVSQTDPHRGVVGAFFAATLMLIGGSFWFLEGLAGVVNTAFYQPVVNYYNIDGSTWGWVHMLLGIVLFAAGLAVFAGQTWGRATGIVVASISAIVNFFFIPWAPIWAITIIAIDIWIIYALWVYRPEHR
jgi:hypothetical protein